MKKRLPAVPQTMQQIQRVADLRDAYIRRTGFTLELKHLCHKFGLYSTTVKRLTPELYEKWNDIHFRWE